MSGIISCFKVVFVCCKRSYKKTENVQLMTHFHFGQWSRNKAVGNSLFVIFRAWSKTFSVWREAIRLVRKDGWKSWHLKSSLGGGTKCHSRSCPPRCPTMRIQTRRDLSQGRPCHMAEVVHQGGLSPNGRSSSRFHSQLDYRRFSPEWTRCQIQPSL